MGATFFSKWAADFTTQVKVVAEHITGISTLENSANQVSTGNKTSSTSQFFKPNIAETLRFAAEISQPDVEATKVVFLNALHRIKDEKVEESLRLFENAKTKIIENANSPVLRTFIIGHLEQHADNLPLLGEVLKKAQEDPVLFARVIKALSKHAFDVLSGNGYSNAISTPTLVKN